MKITKEVDAGYIDVDIEVDIEDFDTDDMIQELVDRGEIDGLIEKIDEKMDSWDFTRRMRDYFLDQMKNHDFEVNEK